MTIGVSVDAQDHIWIIHRGGSLEAMEIRMADRRIRPRRGVAVVAAPPVLEFDEAGNLLGHWGGPG